MASLPGLEDIYTQFVFTANNHLIKDHFTLNAFLPTYTVLHMNEINDTTTSPTRPRSDAWKLSLDKRLRHLLCLQLYPAVSQPRPRLRPRRRPFRAIPRERGSGGVLSPAGIGLAPDRA